MYKLCDNQAINLCFAAVQSYWVTGDGRQYYLYDRDIHLYNITTKQYFILVVSKFEMSFQPCEKAIAVIFLFLTEIY